MVGAPPQQVFDSIVRPAEFRQWFGLDLDIDPRPGGTWRTGGPIGTVLDSEPGELLRLREDSGTSTWSLAEHARGTTLTVSLTTISVPGN